MKKLFIKLLPSLLVFFILIIIIGLSIGYSFHIMDKENRKILDPVGNRIVINKDTLIILDYSAFQQNYTLSNGSKISFELTKKYKLIK